MKGIFEKYNVSETLVNRRLKVIRRQNKKCPDSPSTFKKERSYDSIIIEQQKGEESIQDSIIMNTSKVERW